LLVLFELEKIADSRVMACSTGQQKKVALCSALITEAPILLLDEPFFGWAGFFGHSCSQGHPERTVRAR
jgi:ABC-type sulfate/molybdate transport systems ATPase subunit